MSIRSILNGDDTEDQDRRPVPRRQGRHPALYRGETQYAHSYQGPASASRPIRYRSRSLEVVPTHSPVRPLSHAADRQAIQPMFSMRSSPPRQQRRQSTSRPPRPSYEEEQALFIWYHRTDLAEPWNVVVFEFERQFQDPRAKGGLQCKFYRTLSDWNVEKVRAQAYHPQDSPKDWAVGRYGVIQRTNKRFAWMRPEHYHAPCLPKFDKKQR